MPFLQAFAASVFKVTSDVHVGKGACVGTVIPTRAAIIPAAVGVDIGCGMIAAELDVSASRLPDDIEPLLGWEGQGLSRGYNPEV